MERQEYQENPLLQLLSFDSGGPSSHASHSAKDDPNPNFVVSAGRNGSQWTFLPKPSHDYVQYLADASTYLPKTTSEDVLGSNYLPVGSIHDVIELNATDRNFFYNDPEKGCGFKPANSSTDIDVRKQVGFWRSDNEGEQAVKLSSAPHHLHAETPASRTAEPTGDKRNGLQIDPRKTVVAPGFLPKPQCDSSKRKNIATDRQRRQRIGYNLNALHKLLPNPVEGSQAYILDTIIDYVKYLKIQIKELSGSRLQGEPTAIPLIFREGYGHYINQQMMLNEPLEEMMGKLLEEHPVAGAQLLESKGLFLLPMALVEDLNHAMQVFGGIAHT